MLTLSDYPIIYEQQVAWGDMDAFVHVNNVIYYRYIESARIYYMEALNLAVKEINTVVASNQCKYIAPVFYPDRIKIGVRVEEIRNSAFRMSYLLYSEKQEKVVAIADAVIVCVDKHSMLKVAIPELIRQKIIETELSVNHQF